MSRLSDGTAPWLALDAGVAELTHAAVAAPTCAKRRGRPSTVDVTSDGRTASTGDTDPVGGQMRRWAIGIALVLTMCTAPMAWVDDAENCRDGRVLVETDPARAIVACRRLADQGDAAAQHNLGVLYARGEAVPRDYAEAAKWYFKAAAQGHARAQSRLGNLHYWGKGVRQDFVAASQWYRKAAEQGEPNAQTNLGLMYADGKGVSQDLIQAHLWWSLAARQGSADARKRLGELETVITPAQLAEARKLMAEWKPTTPD
jgi:uncharacterized protein